MAEVLKKLFSADIQKNLYPANEFYKNSKVDAGILADVTEVEVPQSGDDPDIEENPSSFPLAISPRTDNVKKYDVDQVATKPQRFTNSNQLTASYDKRLDILESHINTLNTRVADKMAYVWTPTLATNIVRTSGADKTATLDGATGTRKALRLEDFIEAKRILSRMDAKSNILYGLLSADMEAEMTLAGLNGFVPSDKLSTELLEKGIIAKLFNIHFYSRSRTCRFDNTATPVKKNYTAANQATDNDSLLIWDPKLVRRAEGIVKLYATIDAGEYLGSHVNAEVRAGGTSSRLDQAGVVSIVQAHGS